MTVKQMALTVSGFILLGLGIVGAALPVMPTTPFVIASAVCFSGGNSKFSGWLQKNRYFGSFIEHYRKKSGVPMKTKLTALATLWTGLTLSMVLMQNPLLYIILPIVGGCVTAHILLMRPRKAEDTGKPLEPEAIPEPEE